MRDARQLLKEHLAIAAEILKGNPKAAEKAGSDHVKHALHTIQDIRRGEERVEVSLRRVTRLLIPEAPDLGPLFG